MLFEEAKDYNPSNFHFVLLLRALWKNAAFINVKIEFLEINLSR